MKKILIIENDSTLRALLSQKLKKEGYEVMESDNGVGGLSMMNEFKPDLVLLEMDLPQLTGLDTIEEISKNPALRHIPIIVIANPSWGIDSVRLSELGVRDSLVKTEFDPQELVEKVARQIGR